MPSPWILFVALSVVVSIAAIFMINRSHDADVRTLRKPLWFIVVLVPIVGAIGWFWLGRPEQGPSGKRVAKDRERRGKRQKFTADRQVIVDRLTSDVRTREARTSGLTAGSPGSPGSLTARATKSAASAVERSATSPATATYSDDNRSDLTRPHGERTVSVGPVTTPRSSTNLCSGDFVMSGSAQLEVRGYSRELVVGAPASLGDADPPGVAPDGDGLGLPELDGLSDPDGDGDPDDGEADCGDGDCGGGDPDCGDAVGGGVVGNGGGA